MSRRVATFCWARVWAVLLSVQLHPRPACGPAQHCGCQGRASAARPGSGCSGTQGLLHAQGLEEETFLTPQQERTGVGKWRPVAGVSRGNQNQSSPISGGASVIPHRGWGHGRPGRRRWPSLFRAPPTLAELGGCQKEARLGSMDTGGGADGPSLPVLQLQPAYR